MLYSIRLRQMGCGRISDDFSGKKEKLVREITE